MKHGLRRLNRLASCLAPSVLSIDAGYITGIGTVKNGSGDDASGTHASSSWTSRPSWPRPTWADRERRLTHRIHLEIPRHEHTRPAPELRQQPRPHGRPDHAGDAGRLLGRRAGHRPVLRFIGLATGVSLALLALGGFTYASAAGTLASRLVLALAVSFGGAAHPPRARHAGVPLRRLRHAGTAAGLSRLAPDRRHRGLLRRAPRRF